MNVGRRTASTEINRFCRALSAYCYTNYKVHIVSIIDRVKDVDVNVATPDSVPKASSAASTLFHKEATSSGGLMVHKGLLDPMEVSNRRPSVLVLPPLGLQP